MANNSEKSSSQKENHPKFKRLKKVATTFALASTLTACDNMPNDEVRLNPEEQSARFKIEYQYSEWSAGYNIVDYDITVSKQGDIYMWLINQKNGRNRKKTSIESDSVDSIFDEISKMLDNEQIKEETAYNKDKKVKFVKEKYKNNVSNSENSAETWEIKIKYKPE